MPLSDADYQQLRHNFDSKDKTSLITPDTQQFSALQKIQIEKISEIDCLYVLLGLLDEISVLELKNKIDTHFKKTTRAEIMRATKTLLENEISNEEVALPTFITQVKIVLEDTIDGLENLTSGMRKLLNSSKADILKDLNAISLAATKISLGNASLPLWIEIRYWLLLAYKIGIKKTHRTILGKLPSKEELCKVYRDTANHLTPKIEALIKKQAELKSIAQPVVATPSQSEAEISPGALFADQSVSESVSSNIEAVKPSQLASDSQPVESSTVEDDEWVAVEPESGNTQPNPVSNNDAVSKLQPYTSLVGSKSPKFAHTAFSIFKPEIGQPVKPFIEDTSDDEIQRYASLSAYLLSFNFTLEEKVRLQPYALRVFSIAKAYSSSWVTTSGYPNVLGRTNNSYASQYCDTYPTLSTIQEHYEAIQTLWVSVSGQENSTLKGQTREILENMYKAIVNIVAKRVTLRDVNQTQPVQAEIKEATSIPNTYSPSMSRK